MPRRPNTRSTRIYWLIDTRPETLLAHPTGKPFYCGKTVKDAIERLQAHRVAARMYPGRPISRQLSECGKHVRVDVVEVISPHADWSERERFWIANLRCAFPDCVNVSSGGDGVPGLVHSVSTRAKMSAWQKGIKRHPPTDETRSKIGSANKGRPVSNETRTKLSDLAKNRTTDHRAKISAANTGKILSNETRVKLSVMRKGKLKSPEHRAKISASHIGKIHSAETRIKMSAAAKARRAALTP